MNRLSRRLVYGCRGMICSNSPLAASAGLKVLHEGGNAFDAALAVAATEAVTIVPACGWVEMRLSCWLTPPAARSPASTAAGWRPPEPHQRIIAPRATRPCPWTDRMRSPSLGRSPPGKSCIAGSARNHWTNCLTAPSAMRRTAFRCLLASLEASPATLRNWPNSLPRRLCSYAPAYSPGKATGLSIQIWPAACERWPQEAPTSSTGAAWVAP